MSFSSSRLSDRIDGVNAPLTTGRVRSGVCVPSAGRTMLDSGEGRLDWDPGGDETACAGGRKGDEGSEAGGVVDTGCVVRVK